MPIDVKGYRSLFTDEELKVLDNAGISLQNAGIPTEGSVNFGANSPYGHTTGKQNLSEFGHLTGGYGGSAVYRTNPTDSGSTGRTGEYSSIPNSMFVRPPSTSNSVPSQTSSNAYMDALDADIEDIDAQIANIDAELNAPKPEPLSNELSVEDHKALEVAGIKLEPVADLDPKVPTDKAYLEKSKEDAEILDSGMFKVLDFLSSAGEIAEYYINKPIESFGQAAYIGFVRFGLGLENLAPWVSEEAKQDNREFIKSQNAKLAAKTAGNTLAKTAAVVGDLVGSGIASAATLGPLGGKLLSASTGGTLKSRIGSRALKGGAIGALFGATSESESTGDALKNAAIGAGIGAVATPILEPAVQMASKLAAKTARSVAQLFNKTSPTPGQGQLDLQKESFGKLLDVVGKKDKVPLDKHISQITDELYSKANKINLKGQSFNQLTADYPILTDKIAALRVEALKDANLARAISNKSDSNMQVLHEVRRRLNTEIDSAFSSGKIAGIETLKSLRSELTNQMGKASPDFAAAQTLYTAKKHLPKVMFSNNTDPAELGKLGEIIAPAIGPDAWNSFVRKGLETHMKKGAGDVTYSKFYQKVLRVPLAKEQLNAALSVAGPEAQAKMKLFDQLYTYAFELSNSFIGKATKDVTVGGPVKEVIKTLRKLTSGDLDDAAIKIMLSPDASPKIAKIMQIQKDSDRVAALIKFIQAYSTSKAMENLDGE